MTEINGEVGTGFSVEVAKAWEQAFFDSDTPLTRKVALRTSIVLGK
jgi:NAD dependent epimerase/dehydratase family enzyme